AVVEVAISPESPYRLPKLLIIQFCRSLQRYETDACEMCDPREELDVSILLRRAVGWVYRNSGLVPGLNIVRAPLLYTR
ncbi:MAG: hypothetical protein ACRETY_13135, partial [Steroidobacteraceae bacterium]